MKRFLALCLALLVSLFAGRASAEGEAVEIGVREGVTLIDAGKPVADARAAWVLDGEGPAVLEAAAARANADGRIDLPPRDGGSTVLVWAPGRGPVAVRASPGVPLQVILAPAKSCEIHVATSDGTGVAAAEVLAETMLPVLRASADSPPLLRMSWKATTALDGRARLSDLPDAPLSVRARADGYLEASAFPVDASRGTSLVLTRGSRVTGRLQLMPGGVPPREGAVAHLGDRVARISKEGTFTFETVPPGAWELSFTGTAFVPPAPRTIVLADGTDRGDVVVFAARTSALPGKVHLPAGRTIAGIRLVLEYPPGTAVLTGERIAVVAADGTFRADDLAPGDGVAVTVQAPGFVAKRVAGLSLPSGDDAQPLDVHLDAGVAVTAAVAGADGVAVAGAEVVLFRDEAFRDETTRARTGADGRFTAGGVPPGRTWVRVLGRPAGGSMDFGPFDATLPADGAAPAAAIDLGTLSAFSGWTLAGQAVDVEDRPLAAGTHVVASQDGAEVARADPDTDGRFTLAGLRTGPVAIRVVQGAEAIGAASAALPGAGEIRIVCGLPATVAGRILDRNGAAVASATLRATPVGGVTVDGGPRGVQVRDPAGRFELKLPRGRWRLEADDGQGSTGTRDVVVPGGTRDEVVITVERGVTVTGTLSASHSGTPVEGATVRALVVGDRAASGAARADAAGRFLLRGVPAGPIRLSVETTTGQTFETAPRAGAPQDVLDFGVVEIPPATRLRGEVVGPGGQALSKGLVRVACESGTVRIAPLDTWGRFVMEDLPPGPAVLDLRDETGALLRVQRIRIPWSFEDWVYRLEIDRGTRLTGQVTTGGRPEPFARLTLRIVWPEGLVVAGSADAYGRYTLPPACEGEGELEVAVAGAETGYRQRVRIAGGLDQILNVELPESSVTGLVESVAGVPAIAWAPVELRVPGRADVVARTRSLDDGRFVLRRVPAGTYDLIASAPGFGPAWVRGVVVRPGVDTAEISLLLLPEGRLTVRAVDQEARPVTTAYVVAWPVGGDRASRTGPSTEAFADGLGVLHLRGLSRGTWHVVVGAPGLAERNLGEVRVGEGDQDLGDAWLSRGGLLRVTALGQGRRRGEAGVAIEVLDGYEGDPRPARQPFDALVGDDPLFVTGPGGSVEIPNLAAGSYRVRPAGRPDAEIRVRVRAGSVTDAWLPLPAGPPPGE